MSDEFYFLTLVKRGEYLFAVTVIDLAYCVDYEREDWKTVNSVNYPNHLDAISAARVFAFNNGYPYKPFESRYNSSLNEPWWDVT